jgi:hypothetical protein
MMPQYWSLDTAEKRRRFDEHIAMLILAGKKPVVKFEAPESTRTAAQNRALHLWFEMCAKAFQEAGIDLRAAIREDVEMPVTKNSFKEYIWVPLQRVMTGKRSTTEPSTTEYPEISETIIRHFAQVKGITLPAWPTRYGPGDTDE